MDIEKRWNGICGRCSFSMVVGVCEFVCFRVIVYVCMYVYTCFYIGDVFVEVLGESLIGGKWVRGFV